ncbi:MAG: hydantoinase/oxoprolinase family protein [Candidatus Sericytochromatia bacterium]
MQMKAGIDTGGTFTDCVTLAHNGRLQVHKRLSTPVAPAEAVLSGLRVLQQHGHVSALIHGTTVATNALLERKAAVTTLLITAGFRDVLEIGRQHRASLYDLNVTRPAPLYTHVLEVPERMAADGQVLQSLESDAIAELLAALPPDTESVAVCLLFGYAWPAHEQQLSTALREAGWAVSASHEVLPLYREYERFSTTVANAALQPVMAGYMHQLSAGLAELSCRLMQSNGGLLPPAEVARLPVRCALSGPAGGVIGAHALGRSIGRERLLTFDMGGTSTDVALLDRGLPLRHEAQIGGIPLALPMLAIHTVGAGGGSLVSLNAGGALKVGPESAGAVPGPMCYGQGQQLTVTDAHVLLGRLPASVQLGGSLALQRAPVEQAFARLAAQLQVSPEAAAEGVLAVANAHMERALRVVSVEQGENPADYALFCFGGAGGLHACDLARQLQMRTIVVPVCAGVFSALGMLFAEASFDRSQTVLGQLEIDDVVGVSAAFASLAADLPQGAEGIDHASVALRYRGQSFEISVPWGPDVLGAFHQAHKRLHGYQRPDYPVELVSLHLSRRVPETPPTWPAWQSAPDLPPLPAQRVWAEGHWQEVPVYARAALRVKQVLTGPTLVLEDTTTTWIAPDFKGHLDPLGNLILERLHP